jgi:hypothetical protein
VSWATTEDQLSQVKEDETPKKYRNEAPALVAADAIVMRFEKVAMIEMVEVTSCDVAGTPPIIDAFASS